MAFGAYVIFFHPLFDISEAADQSDLIVTSEHFLGTIFTVRLSGSLHETIGYLRFITST